MQLKTPNITKNNLGITCLSLFLGENHNEKVDRNIQNTIKYKIWSIQIISWKHITYKRMPLLPAKPLAIMEASHLKHLWVFYRAHSKALRKPYCRKFFGPCHILHQFYFFKPFHQTPSTKIPFTPLYSPWYSPYCVLQVNYSK